MDGVYYSSLTEGDFDPTQALLQSLVEGDFLGGVAISPTTRDGAARGGYALANGSGQYELYHGIDAEPDFSGAADETFASLPHNTSLTLSAGHSHYLVTRYRNAYGLVSANIASTIITLDAEGAEQPTPPLDPLMVELSAGAAGVVNLTAVYPVGHDPDPADTWLIYLTSNGVDPDPDNDTPTEVSMPASRDSVNLHRLSWTSDAFAEGATIKVIVRTRRSGTPDVDSENTTVYSTTATSVGPASPSAGLFAGGRQQFD